MSPDLDLNMRRTPSVTRPRMPRGYGILGEDAGSGLLPWIRAEKRFAASRNYWIHTSHANGRPHVKPVWGLWFEGRFYFSTDSKSVTALNLSRNRRLTVHLESGDDAVILEGFAEEITDPVLLSNLDEAYFAKYSYHLMGLTGSVVYALKHQVGFAWLERDFTGSATKYDFST